MEENKKNMGVRGRMCENSIFIHCFVAEMINGFLQLFSVAKMCCVGDLLNPLAVLLSFVT